MVKACSRPRTAQDGWRRKPKWHENPSTSQSCRFDPGLGHHQAVRQASAADVNRVIARIVSPVPSAGHCTTHGHGFRFVQKLYRPQQLPAPAIARVSQLGHNSWPLQRRLCAWLLAECCC